MHPVQKKEESSEKYQRVVSHAEVTDQANPPAGYVAIPFRPSMVKAKEEELTNEKTLISWLGGEEEVAPNPGTSTITERENQKMQLLSIATSHLTAEGTAC